MFVLLTSINPRSFYFAEYEILTAILVETKLQGYSLFWGVMRPAKTAQLALTDVTELRNATSHTIKEDGLRQKSKPGRISSTYLITKWTWTKVAGGTANLRRGVVL